MERTKNDIKKDMHFGLFLAVFCLGIAGYFYLQTPGLNLWLVGAGALFLVAALIYPIALHPLRLAMEWLGHWLGIVNTYVLLTLIYILFFVPLNLIFSISGKDPLNLKRDGKASTYWVDSPDQGESSMKNQF